MSGGRLSTGSLLALGRGLSCRGAYMSFYGCMEL